MDSPATPSLTIEAIVFDVLGTLVDEATEFKRTSEELATIAGLNDPAALNANWDRLLGTMMDRVVDGSEPWRPHGEIVAESGREVIEDAGGTISEKVDSVLATVDRRYCAYPDVADGIRALRSSRLVAALSNGDLSSLAQLALRNDLAWHVALSTGAVRTFKPADVVYRYAIDALDLDPGRSLFVAAHPWDLRAAARFGFRTAYIERPATGRPRDDDRFDFRAASLLELAAMLDADDAVRA